MAVVTFILLLAGFVFFLLSAFGVSPARVNFLALGLACWILVPLIAALPIG